MNEDPLKEALNMVLNGAKIKTDENGHKYLILLFCPDKDAARSVGCKKYSIPFEELSEET